MGDRCEPPTAAQESYLHTLAREAGEQVPDDLTKAQASGGSTRLAGGDRPGPVTSPGRQAVQRDPVELSRRRLGGQVGGVRLGPPVGG